MPLDFRQKRPAPAPRRRPPPDYASRGVKFRLFAIVGGLMLLLMVMSRVRDPDFWMLLGFHEPGIAGGPPLTEAEIVRKNVDTRLPTPPDAALKDTIPIATDKPSSEPAGPEPATASADTSNQVAWDHGWATILDALKSSERTLLFQVTCAGRHRVRLTDERIAEWLFLADKLDTEWRSYRDDALRTVADLPENEQIIWREVVAQLEIMWASRCQPALAASVVGEALSDAQQQALVELQSTLDTFALAEIRDGTIDRPQEKEAWFRLWEQLQVTSAEALRSQSLGPIGFLQLYEQPRDYRGKLVTVRGTVQQGYHVTERKNPQGIAGYYVFTLRPAGGPPRPIIIYTLEIPAGFPPVADRDVDKTTTVLHEDVEFTGFFFKKWAYQAKDGINLAPLLLAKSPRWQPSAVASLTEPSPFGFTVIVAACAVGAIALVAWLFQRS